MTQPLSIIRGPALEDEEGLGTLTLTGWLREICEAGGSREALVFYENGQRIAWSYDDLWARANEVARALIACGTGKGTRVGVLMTNRPEFLSAVWGTALAGSVATTLNTFSTRAELDHLLKASGVSVLLMEGQVLKKDFAAMLGEIEPAVKLTGEGQLMATALPFSEMLFTGRPFTAAEMDQTGFINSVVPRDRLEAEVDKYADACSRSRPVDVVVAQKTFLETYKQYRGEYLGSKLTGWLEGMLPMMKPDRETSVDLGGDAFDGGIAKAVKNNDRSYPPEWRLSRKGREAKE